MLGCSLVYTLNVGRIDPWTQTRAETAASRIGRRAAAMSIVLGLFLSACGTNEFDCPITEPNGYVPPETVTAPRLDEYRWHGTAELFTPFNADGSYFWRKTVLWSANFPGGSVEERPKVDVTWERLDVEPPPLSNDGDATNAYTPDDGWFMIAGIDPNELGCWQVTAEYKGAVLTYVYEIRVGTSSDR